MTDTREMFTPGKHDPIMKEKLAKFLCILAGIEVVDSADGSQNWWVFQKEADEIVDGIRKRFPVHE